MKKITEIYITKDRVVGMNGYSTGLFLICEDGEILEGISTDVMEQFTKSKVTAELIKAKIVN